MPYRIIIEFDSAADHQEVFNVVCEVSDYVGESIETFDKEAWFEEGP